VGTAGCLGSRRIPAFLLKKNAKTSENTSTYRKCYELKTMLQQTMAK